MTEEATEGTFQTKVFPVYVAIDVSASMAGERIAAANDIVPALIEACRQFQALADVLRFSVVTFNNSAATVVPMGDYEDAESRIPALKASGGTSYGAAFREIQSAIEKDIADLKVLGNVVMRPSVFFITDGEPNDTTADRQAAWAALTDTSWRPHPNVVTFGVGEATKETLAKYVSHKGKAFITRDGATAKEGLLSIMEMLVMSVVASANNLASGNSDGLILPDPDGDLEEV